MRSSIGLLQMFLVINCVASLRQVSYVQRFTLRNSALRADESRSQFVRTSAPRQTVDRQLVSSAGAIKNLLSAIFVAVFEQAVHTIFPPKKVDMVSFSNSAPLVILDTSETVNMAIPIDQVAVQQEHAAKISQTENPEPEKKSWAMSARYLEQLKKSKAVIGDTKAAKSNEIKLPLPEDISLSTEDYDLPIEASVKMAALTEAKSIVSTESEISTGGHNFITAKHQSKSEKKSYAFGARYLEQLQLSKKTSNIAQVLSSELLSKEAAPTIIHSEGSLFYRITADGITTIKPVKITDVSKATKIKPNEPEAIGIKYLEQLNDSKEVNCALDVPTVSAVTQPVEQPAVLPIHPSKKTWAIGAHYLEQLQEIKYNTALKDAVTESCFSSAVGKKPTTKVLNLTVVSKARNIDVPSSAIMPTASQVTPIRRLAGNFTESVLF